LFNDGSGIEKRYFSESARVRRQVLKSTRSKVKFKEFDFGLLGPNSMVEFQSKPILGVKF